MTPHADVQLVSRQSELFRGLRLVEARLLQHQYCGQNLPDAPTWQFLTPGWKTTVSVSGFQVYRLPCDVTGLRAILHLRNNGLLTPPTETEMIAETMFPTALHLVR